MHLSIFNVFIYVSIYTFIKIGENSRIEKIIWSFEKLKYTFSLQSFKIITTRKKIILILFLMDVSLDRNPLENER